MPDLVREWLTRMSAETSKTWALSWVKISSGTLPASAPEKSVPFVMLGLPATSEVMSTPPLVMPSAPPEVRTKSEPAVALKRRLRGAATDTDPAKPFASLTFSPATQAETASRSVVTAATMLPSAALVELRAKKTPLPSSTVSQPPRMAAAPEPRPFVVSVVTPLAADWVPDGSTIRKVPSCALMARVSALRLRTMPLPATGLKLMTLLPPLPSVKLATVWATPAEALPFNVSTAPRISSAEPVRSLVAVFAA